MIERIIGATGKLTSSIRPLGVGLFLAIACTTQPTATLPGVPASTNTPAPPPTPSPVYGPTVASPQPAETPTQTLGPTPVPTVVLPAPADTLAPTVTPAASNATTSDIRNFALENLTVAPGTTVTWTNRDGSSHTVTSGTPQGQDGVWDSPVLSGGDAFSFTFAEPGAFPYFCRIHNSMRATVTVDG